MEGANDFYENVQERDKNSSTSHVSSNSHDPLPLEYTWILLEIGAMG